MPGAHHASFVVDVTDEAAPFPIATFRVREDDLDSCQRGGRFGAHSQSWSHAGPFCQRHIVAYAYFNAGVRVVDMSDPSIRRRSPPGIAIQTNNVEVDDRGRIYLAGRGGAGLHVVELTGRARRILMGLERTR